MQHSAQEYHRGSGGIICPPPEKVMVSAAVCVFRQNLWVLHTEAHGEGLGGEADAGVRQLLEQQPAAVASCKDHLAGAHIAAICSPQQGLMHSYKTRAKLHKCTLQGDTFKVLGAQLIAGKIAMKSAWHAQSRCRATP